MCLPPPWSLRRGREEIGSCASRFDYQFHRPRLTDPLSVSDEFLLFRVGLFRPIDARRRKLESERPPTEFVEYDEKLYRALVASGASNGRVEVDDAELGPLQIVCNSTFV